MNDAVPDSNPAPAAPLDRVALFEKVEKSVVIINVESPDGASNGSGYVVDTDGTVVTNYHVVEGALRATALFKDGSKVPVRGFVHLDHKRDIAILKITAAPEQLIPIAMASSAPRKGESVYAFGAPYGLDFTASEGIVSAIRETSDLENTIGLEDHEGTWIQTTAAISPGNSGGPLCNTRGEVVAMNTMQLSIGQNLNFALSCDDVRDAIDSMKTNVVKLSPTTVPVRLTRAQRNAPPPEDDGPRPDGTDGIPIVDVTGTDEAKLRLGKLQEVQFKFLDATPRRSVSVNGQTGAVPIFGRAVDRIRATTEKNLETRTDLRLVYHDGATLFVVLRAGGNEVVEFVVNMELLELDKSQGRPRLVRVWRNSEKVMSVTVQALLRGVFPRSFESNVRKLVNRLRDDHRLGRKAVQEQAAAGK